MLSLPSLKNQQFFQGIPVLTRGERYFEVRVCVLVSSCCWLYIVHTFTSVFVCIKNREFTLTLAFLIMGSFLFSFYITPLNIQWILWSFIHWVPCSRPWPHEWMPPSLCLGSNTLCQAVIILLTSLDPNPALRATSAQPQPLARCLSCSGYPLTSGMNCWERSFFFPFDWLLILTF